MKNILTTLLLTLSFSSLAQVNLDSLWNVWNDKTRADTSRLNAMFIIAWHGYLFSQPDSAFYFAQLQYDFAESVNHKQGMANALNTQGASFYIKGNYAEAIIYYKKLLKFGDKKGISSSLNNIGLIYQAQGDFAMAIDYLIKGLKSLEEIGDKKGISSSLNNIGLIYQKQGDLPKAMDYYTKGLKIDEELESLTLDLSCLIYEANSLIVIKMLNY